MMAMQTVWFPVINVVWEIGVHSLWQAWYSHTQP